MSTRRETTPELRARLQKARRTNRRLRAIIDEFRVEVRAIRGDLEIQFRRIAQLQAELDTTKRPTSFVRFPAQSRSHFRPGKSDRPKSS
jgi:hypothetical protein